MEKKKTERKEKTKGDEEKARKGRSEEKEGED